MKHIYLSLLIVALMLSTTSCLEQISGGNVKNLIPGLTMPKTDESKIAVSVQGVYDASDVSSEIFSILGPLANLGGLSVSGSSVGVFSITHIKDALSELGEHDPSGGHYTQIIDEAATSGISKIYFRNAIEEIIFLDFQWIADFDLATQPIPVYESITTSSTVLDAKSTFGGTMYLPGLWRLFNDPDSQPTNWLPVTYAGDFETYSQETSNSVNTFLTNTLTDFKSMRVVTRAQQTDRIIDMTYVVTMNESFTPTDDDPVIQEGSGTITFTDENLKLTINYYRIEIGEYGPLRGKVYMNRSDGYLIKMSYEEDGSSDGTIYKDGKLLATVHINADGTGTYTDASGKTYPIG